MARFTRSASGRREGGLSLASLSLAAERAHPPRDRCRYSRSGLYYQGVTTLPARMTAVRRGLADRLEALPARRQEQIQDAGLAVALAAVNVVSVLPYRAHLHPLWLALLLLRSEEHTSELQSR